MRRFIRTASIATAAAAALMLTTGTAQAVAWYSWVPERAEDVTSVSEDVMSDGNTLLQIRRGKLNGTTYLWGRVANPASKYNSDHNLVFTVGGQCVNSSAGKVTKDIDTTTFTSATKQNSSCGYWANIVKKSTGKVVGGAYYSP